jgi:hypothetical protein
VASTIGALAAAAFGCIPMLSRFTGPLPFMTPVMLLYGFWFALPQWLVLRRRVRHAWLWLPATWITVSAAWIIGFTTGALLTPLGGFLIAGAGIAAAQAIVLMPLSRAGCWTLVGLPGAIVMGIAGLGVIASLPDQCSFNTVGLLAAMAAAGAGYGLMTGWALAYILRPDADGASSLPAPMPRQE